MNFRKLSAVFIAAIIGLTTAAAVCAEETIRIGWLSSLTGALSSAAIAENQGVQFAVEEINQAGGINGTLGSVTGSL